MSTRSSLPAQVPTVWSRRRLLASLAIGGLTLPTVASLLASCGDPTTGSGTTGPDTTGPGTTAPSTSEPPAGITHPSGPDAEVLRLFWEGGMIVPWMAQYPPTMLISGDGRVFVPGAVPEIYPGPLLTPVFVRSITEAGVQTILAMLRDEGLFVDPTPGYELPDGVGIADASTTVLRFTADGATYVHRAYALGFGDDLDATTERARLLAVTQRLGDLPALVGASVGAEEPFAPEAYRMYAWEADPTTGVPDLEPTIVPWPGSTGVVLSEIASRGMSEPTCALVAAADAGDLFTSANQLTFFEEAGVTYQLSVTPVLPGDDVC